MKKNLYTIRERLYYLRTLRINYIRIQWRYFLRRAREWTFLKSFWKYFFTLILICLIIFAILHGYQYSWTGFSNNVNSFGEPFHGKTLWDWMDLILIPCLLGFIAYLFTNAQKSRELSVALLNKREQALQQYFDYMTNLLINIDYSSEEQFEVTRRIARARTMAVLEMLDGRQKGHILRFLIESELIHKDQPFFSMRRADLRKLDIDPGLYHNCDLQGANLDGASLPWCNFSDSNMSGITIQEADLEAVDFNGSNLNYALLSKSDLYRARLRKTHLTKADFQNTNLQYVDLSKARIGRASMKSANLRAATLHKTYLRFTDLSFANLSDADLTDADLSETNLFGANFRNANLSGANLKGSNATLRQLRKAKSIEGAKLPNEENE